MNATAERSDVRLFNLVNIAQSRVHTVVSHASE
jgi:hypothetical protein